MIRYNYIAVEGNIGAGKTSLATRVAADFNASLILEQFEDNPFLPKFYEDQGKYAFPLELSFLASRYQQLKDRLSSGDLFSPFVIADYFINKSLIFARNTIEGDELALFSRLYHIIAGTLPKPDLILFLYSEVAHLRENIRRRGRTYEQSIEASYLERIQKGYLEHLRQVTNIPVLVVDANQLDFVNSKEDYDKIVLLLEGSYLPGFQAIEF